MRPRRSVPLPVVRALALLGASLFLWHGVAQATGAVQWWAPCFEQGYGSDDCGQLQYGATGPHWYELFRLWPLEALLAVAVLALAAVTRHRLAWAATGTVFALCSNVLFDHALTPLFNGFYQSADDHPGLGLFGAACLVFAGVCFVLAGLLPRERARAASPGLAASVAV